MVPFNASYAPGPKKFDFDINQISITPKRAEHVDFCEPYFTAPQAVVALKDTPAASATSLAELADAKLGVQVGTTSLDAVKASIKPKSQPQVFNDSNDTVRALKGKRVDAIVVDLPTAFYLTARAGAGGEDRRPVRGAGRRPLGHAAGEGLQAHDVRQPGAGQGRRRPASSSSCRTNGWAGTRPRR